MTTTQPLQPNSGDSSSSATPVIKPLWFPASTFARIEPELYLARHLAQGVRPGSNRGFHEFRDVTVQTGSLGNTDTTKDNSSNKYNSTRAYTVGSSVVRSGGTSVACGIVAGTTSTVGGGGVYPNIEILRGGFNSAPSTEEMVLSQRVYEVLKAVLGSDDRTGNFNIRLVGESGSDEDEDESKSEQFGETTTTTLKGQWLVLTAHVQVLSRAGPPFDLVWRAVISALQDVQLPFFKLDEDDDRKLICLGTPTTNDGPRFKFPSGKFDILSSTFGVTDIEHEEQGFESSSTGTGKPILLADLDGEIEESCVKSTINVVCDQSQGGKDKSTTLYGVSIGVVGTSSLRGTDVGEGLQIQRELISRALALARSR